jgi:reverse transcriptase-like protein
MEKYLSQEIIQAFHNKKNYPTGADRVSNINFLNNQRDLISNLLSDLEKKQYSPTKLKIKNIKNREVYIPSIRDNLIYSLLKENLQHKYKIKFQSRDSNIKKIISFLEKEDDLTIFKIDIKNFFNSIPHEKVIERCETQLISEMEFMLISKLLNKHKKIAQGLSISNILSEIYLETFDIALRTIDPKLCAYFRFVDDIILIFNGHLSENDKKKTNQKIEDIFSDHQLLINESKLEVVK